MAKRSTGGQGALVALRDPNSGEVVGQTPGDSGYYTGNSTAMGMDELDVERPVSQEHSIRPAASSKSLLVSAERCED